MKIHFDHLSGKLLEGISELSDILDISITDGEGIKIRVVQMEGPIQVALKDGQGLIRYQESIHFFRALGLFLEQARERALFELTAEPKFDFNGTMLDVSRNGVLKVAVIKQFIRYMALMGLNGLMMYTEDTYEVEEQPYFGYMRGRYTASELKECDDYADLFGIEMIPCIQTLGHLQQALKWGYAADMKDHADILLAGEPKTYAFIEQMITAASGMFRSKRIHIGMDEAFQVGLGNYLKLNGVQDRFQIMNDHVNRVLAITDRLGLEPMIWSDMYFNLLANDYQGALYNVDADFSDDNMSRIPKGVQFVYWDYGRRDENGYEQLYEKHMRLGSKPIFAGGIHMWNSICPNNGKTWMTSQPALRAAKTKGIREVIATAWGDNGNESNHLVILAGLQLFAEHGYGDEVDDKLLTRRLAACTGIDLFESLNALKYMDEVPGVSEGNHWMANPSKYLLWQDPLLGLLDKHVEGEAEAVLPQHYAGLERRWRQCKEQFPAPFSRLYEFYERLASVLVIKSTLGVTLKKWYKTGQKDQLAELAAAPDSPLLVLKQRIEALRLSHRALWMNTYKPFGWEVLDLRYGGLLARISSTQDRLADYVDGHIEEIEELEAERLPFDQNGLTGRVLEVNVTYQAAVTASCFI
ncbi:beta-N-acetylhexosaminidase [Paenibacillus glucanolyticus]|uniref:beta-N-acetylhexosaminidase n=1 Tax=Paenibacillus glucanolyticus TaxID=59843 RepID=UPI000EAA1312|nr:beta-N-acetylhexosaminidase [Moraxella catarrhalis]